MIYLGAFGMWVDDWVGVASEEEPLGHWCSRRASSLEGREDEGEDDGGKAHLMGLFVMISFCSSDGAIRLAVSITIRLSDL